MQSAIMRHGFLAFSLMYVFVQQPVPLRMHKSYEPISIVDKEMADERWEKLTFSSTVFLIFTLASTTVFPALFTALYKNPPRLFAPASAFVETNGRQETKIKIDALFPVRSLQKISEKKFSGSRHSEIRKQKLILIIQENSKKILSLRSNEAPMNEQCRQLVPTQIRQIDPSQDSFAENSDFAIYQGQREKLRNDYKPHNSKTLTERGKGRPVLVFGLGSFKTAVSWSTYFTKCVPTFHQLFWKALEISYTNILIIIIEYASKMPTWIIDVLELALQISLFLVEKEKHPRIVEQTPSHSCHKPI
ncbi:hypothetical protein EAG_11636 [Camponotus floridanus]|uniref:Uncharacterized protein n=1 Tax=Camponotus floridanus TaxID=104421 RepID=E2B009_CAMFO|nr:hypothetical protein EAG_11636 [Camponotus floridanus]